MKKSKLKSLTKDFSPNTTGSAISQKITASLKVPDGFKNSGEILIGTVSATQPTITAPEVITQHPLSRTTTKATLAGSLTNNSVNVTAQGFYYGYNASNTALTLSEIKNGGTGITNNSTTSSTIRNNFNADLTGLPDDKIISYAAFATNAVGTTDGAVKTFRTIAIPPVSTVSGTEYIVVPAIADTSAGNTDEVVNRSPGYGDWQKSSTDYVVTIVAPASTGVYADRTDIKELTFHLPSGGTSYGFYPGWAVSPNGIASGSNPGGLNLSLTNGVNSGTTAAFWIPNPGGLSQGNTSYQITIPAYGSMVSKTFTLNIGNPSGTYYTSTLTLNLTGCFVGKMSVSALKYNTGTSPTASYQLGPATSGEVFHAIIPLNDVNTDHTSTSDSTFKTNFDAAKLTVTCNDTAGAAMTLGQHWNYFVEYGSSACLGVFPGIIFSGKPEELGATPTVNITYTP